MEPRAPQDAVVRGQEVGQPEFMLLQRGGTKADDALPHRALGDQVAEPQAIMVDVNTREHVQRHRVEREGEGRGESARQVEPADGGQGPEAQDVAHRVERALALGKDTP